MQACYCDVRQPQQKGGCKRNHAELRKLLPKGRGVSFGNLASQPKPEPRPLLAGPPLLSILCIADEEAPCRMLRPRHRRAE